MKSINSNNSIKNKLRELSLGDLFDIAAMKKLPQLYYESGLRVCLWPGLLREKTVYISILFSKHFLAFK